MKKILYTELVLESASSLKSGDGFSKTIKKCKCGILQTHIRVLNKEAEQKSGQEIGDYINLSFNELLYYDIKAREILKTLLIENIKKITKQIIKKPKKVLVVGLGNEKYACDSLGKMVVDNIFISKPYIDKDLLDKKVPEVYAVSFGVYGTTGLESSKTIKAICDMIKPDMLIAIDSLVASQPKNLCKSLQLSNTKLSPGGGVGNNRQEVSEKTLGVKVFAIGVPLVVSINEKDFDNLIVTPKDVEQKVQVLSKIIAKAINLSFCNISEKELDSLTL